MKRVSNEPLLVVVTAPSVAVARKLARAALRGKLVACVNLVPGLESHYWWKGKLEKSSEVLMILKATAASVPELEQLVLKLHPYDTPEFLVLRIRHSAAKYLAWWLASIA